MNGLTPEQIARAIVAEPDWCNCTLATGEIDFARLRAHIAAAFRTVASTERAALQRIAGTRGMGAGAEMRRIAEDALQGMAQEPPF